MIGLKIGDKYLVTGAFEEEWLFMLIPTITFVLMLVTKNGYDVKPLSKGSYKGIPFEEGGGFKVNWGGDRILQYHPADASHHGGAYFKISSGETGTIRIDLDGNIIE
jgi:hypothetical protein